MCLTVRGNKPIDGDMRVDLRGRERGVTQHLLDAAQIGTTFEQVSGGGVPQAVRPHVGNGSGRSDPRVNDASRGPLIEPASSCPDEQRTSR